jgi:hypothetical protein
MAIARATVTNLVILRLSALAFEDPGVLLALALAGLRRRHSQPGRENVDGVNLAAAAEESGVHIPAMAASCQMDRRTKGRFK